MAATDPASFTNPHSFRNKAARLLWIVTWTLLFRPTPWFMGAWRSFLLRLFGARLGHARFHPSTRIWAPWRLKTGDHVYTDRGVYLYNPFGITIHDRVVISFSSTLCTASHDIRKPDLPLIGKPITLESDVWIAAETFIAPGVTIRHGAVVGARAVVTRNVDPWTVVAGNPAKPVAQRNLQQDHVA